MNKIFVTGDTHQFEILERFSFRNFPLSRELDKDDFVVILGDFGVFWEHTGITNTEKYLLDWMGDKPYSFIIILGNHECYPRIYNEFPLEYDDKVKGKVRKPRDNIYILETGELYDIAGKTVLAINGAPSHDISDGILDPNDPDFKQKKKGLDKRWGTYRIKGVSWWPEELPSQHQRQHVIDTLDKYSDKIDYIFSHDAPSEAVLAFGFNNLHEFNRWLQNIWNSYELYNKGVKWYFGHYHINRSFNPFFCLYTNITRIL